MPFMMKGTELSAQDRQHVLAAYVHRFTRDHKPAWAYKPRPSGNPYNPHFTNDAEWLAHTFFSVTKMGRLDRRVMHCESSPTWPDGTRG